MLLFFLLGLAISPVAYADSLDIFKTVLEERVTSMRNPEKDMMVSAKYDRVRKWLPSSPQVSYASNDSRTWNNYIVSTSIPIPMKSWHRDEVENANKQYIQASAQSIKQDIFKKTLAIFLDCAVPSELEILMRKAFEDQSSVFNVLNTLYSYGKIPQSDRVSAQLSLRQIEAQVNMYDARAKAACEKWEDWARISRDTKDPEFVPTDLDNAYLKRIGLESGQFRNVTNKKLLSLTVAKEKLWSKFIPDVDFTYMKSNYFNLYLSGGPPRKWTTSWMVGMTLPLTYPLFDHSDFKRERAELSLSKVEAELQKAEADKDWEESRNDWMRISSRLKQIWDVDAATADVLVESTLSAYQHGKSGFAELALARRTRLDLRIEEIQLKAERLYAKTVCLTECER